MGERKKTRFEKKKKKRTDMIEETMQMQSRSSFILPHGRPPGPPTPISGPAKRPCIFCFRCVRLDVWLVGSNMARVVAK